MYILVLGERCAMELQRLCKMTLLQSASARLLVALPFPYVNLQCCAMFVPAFALTVSRASLRLRPQAKPWRLSLSLAYIINVCYHMYAITCMLDFILYQELNPL